MLSYWLFNNTLLETFQLGDTIKNIVSIISRLKLERNWQDIHDTTIEFNKTKSCERKIVFYREIYINEQNVLIEDTPSSNCIKCNKKIEDKIKRCLCKETCKECQKDKCKQCNYNVCEYCLSVTFDICYRCVINNSNNNE